MYEEPEKRHSRKIDPELKRNCFWGKAISTAASIMGGNAAAGAAKRLTKKGGKQYAKAGESYDLLGGMAEDWLARYTELYEPIERGLAEKVQEGPDYEGVQGRAATDVSMAYDKADEAEQRRLSRYGIDPSQGRSDTASELDRARSEVGAKERGYTQEEDRDWARKMTFTNMGRGLEAGAAGAYGQIAGGYKGMGDSYLGRAADAQQQASSMYQTAGKAISGMFSGGLPSIPGMGGGGGGGTAAPVSGFDYGIPTSSVYGDQGGGGFDYDAGYGDNQTDYG